MREGQRQGQGQGQGGWGATAPGRDNRGGSRQGNGRGQRGGCAPWFLMGKEAPGCMDPLRCLSHFLAAAAAAAAAVRGAGVDWVRLRHGRPLGMALHLPRRERWITPQVPQPAGRDAANRLVSRAWRALPQAASYP